MLLSYFASRRDCQSKRAQREQQLSLLSATFHQPITPEDEAVLSSSASTLISNVQSGKWSPTSILDTYGKRALLAQQRLNCLSEILFADAEAWARDIDVSDRKKKGPLAGMPISLKDTTDVEGYDSCLGYSAWVNRPAPVSSPLVRLLIDAGAIPFVKTTTPITLLSYEATSPVFGRTLNPHVPTHSPGGSSGGEAALLAFGGSRIGIGTDVAGSVRVPAHYCGIYSIKSSGARFPSSGLTSSINGLEGVPTTCAPMTKTLEDLETMWKAVMNMKPWEYDHAVVPIPWRNVELLQPKFGVMWDDGVVPPSPACRRALQIVVSSLKLEGYRVVDFDSPDPYQALKISSQLILADAGRVATKDVRPGETKNAPMGQFMLWSNLPRIFKHIYIWYVRYIKRDPLYADLLCAHIRAKTAEENWSLVAQREAYRGEWFDAWNEAGLDFLLTVPNAMPAVPEGGMKHTWKACGYAVLFNLLDYTAGVLPVTKVDRRIDALEAEQIAAVKKMNTIAKQAYALYDHVAMDGLPVGVQVVGQRYEEEKVLEGMKIIEKAMAARNVGYEAGSHY